MFLVRLTLFLLATLSLSTTHANEFRWFNGKNNIFVPLASQSITADCTRDPSAFNKALKKIENFSQPAGIKIEGDCEVDSALRFRGVNVSISGRNRDFQCGGGGRLISTARELTIQAIAGAFLTFDCVEIAVAGGRVKLDSALNSFINVAGLTAPTVEIFARNQSAVNFRNYGYTENAVIEVVIAFDKSKVDLSGAGFIEGAGVFIEQNSDLRIAGGTGSIYYMNIDNGSSVDMGGLNTSDPPPVSIAAISFGSRLRGVNYVSEVRVDDSSVAIDCAFC